MKLPIPILALLTVCCLMLLAAPAMAGTVYDNGPINGGLDGWTINFGFVISDSFTVSTGNSTINDLAFGVWLFPGDTLTSVQVSLTSDVNGGVTYFDQMVNFTQSGCTLNIFRFDVCTATGSFDGPSLANGTYWLNLQNASVPNGDPVYWDENSGIGCMSPGCPSMGFANGIGSIPSESFTLYGNPTGTTPEPSSVLLFGSGILALAGVLRRKLKT
jgi:hypothetical protein